MNNSLSKIPFVKYHTCLSYMFTPSETRFILHMLDIEYMSSRGYHTYWSRKQYMERMGLSEYSFDKSIKRLVELNLLSKRNNKLKNRVYYKFNLTLYNRLITILTVTSNTKRLIDFCNCHFKDNPRSIESITGKEINNLRLSEDMEEEKED